MHTHPSHWLTTQDALKIDAPMFWMPSFRNSWSGRVVLLALPLICTVAGFFFLLALVTYGCSTPMVEQYLGQADFVKECNEKFLLDWPEIAQHHGKAILAVLRYVLIFF
jgi:hypothetical protein